MTEKDAAVRAKLIALLAPTADGAALPVLRRALDDADPGVADAAARGELAEWPTATARDDMLELVREAKDETHRLLAFAGLVRLVTLDVNTAARGGRRRPQDAVGLGVEAGRAETGIGRARHLPVPGGAGPGQRAPAE